MSTNQPKDPLERELAGEGAEFLSSGFKPPEKLSNKARGNQGEEEAVKHLASLGYRIVKRNFKYGRVGEIDIVAYDGDTLVFVEVKARTSVSHGAPEAAVDRRKQAQLKRVARFYYYVNGLGDVICRFDVIAIETWKKTVEIRHHKNAFI